MKSLSKIRLENPAINQDLEVLEAAIDANDQMMVYRCLCSLRRQGIPDERLARYIRGVAA